MNAVSAFLPLSFPFRRLLVLSISFSSLGLCLVVDGIEFVFAEFEDHENHKEDAVDEDHEDETSLHILSLRHIFKININISYLIKAIQTFLK